MRSKRVTAQFKRAIVDPERMILLPTCSFDANLPDNTASVNHPAHYNIGTIEVIDAIEDWKLGFNLGNVVKYVVRADYKNNAIEDLNKAKWYLEREIERRQKL